MLAGTGVATFIAYPLAFVEAWAFPENWRLALFAAGVLMVVLGSVLRRYCWRTLGQYFTGDVRVKPGQPVIRSGPYRLVRHPSYTAGMMMYIGTGLALGSWLSLALLTIATIATYAYRVAIEERALLETIGEPYRAYMKERKRFIPYVV
jgi:protein-S-isoprenylcysteine O-methyltransferase